MEEKIELIKNGPLVAKGIKQCKNSRGEPLDVQENMYLCRCGGSQKKPFCDGTHKKIGFSDARVAGSGPAPKDYVGRQITIHDNRSVCAHIGYCTEHSPEVFRLKQEPWIDADGDAADKTIRTIDICPSGALSYSINRAAQQVESTMPCIQILRDGPYFVTGGVKLACDAAPHIPDRYTLCRCGASKNKPYCDGSHWDSGFRDEKN